MKTCAIPHAILACGALFVNMAAHSVEETTPTTNEPAASATEFFVPQSGGSLRALKILSDIPRQSWTGHVNTIYLPDSGIAWTGFLNEGHQAALEDRVLAFDYFAGNERLRVSASTNRYAPNLNDLSELVQTELEQYKAGRGRFGGDPRYVVEIESLLGSAALRDRVLPPMEGVPDVNLLSVDTKPSQLRAVAVEGTNVVVSIEFGTNMLAMLAFDKFMRPVWATTNGVSIGPIRTNTVRYIGVKPDGRREMEVVY